VYGAANVKADPRGWWQWTVKIAEGWVTLRRQDWFPERNHWIIDDDRAKLGRTRHNSRYFLCWPPGFIRFTSPLSHDHTRYRVTIKPNRGLRYSEPVEKVHPFGYAQLFHKPGTLITSRRTGGDEPHAVHTPSLFDEVLT